VETSGDAVHFSRSAFALLHSATFGIRWFHQPALSPFLPDRSMCYLLMEIEKAIRIKQLNYRQCRMAHEPQDVISVDLTTKKRLDSLRLFTHRWANIPKDFKDGCI
jgi:hypothetical protein